MQTIFAGGRSTSTSTQLASISGDTLMVDLSFDSPATTPVTLKSFWSRGRQNRSRFARLPEPDVAYIKDWLFCKTALLVWADAPVTKQKPNAQAIIGYVIAVASFSVGRW